MKILYLGDLGVGQTALMRMRALERLGHTIRGVNTVAPWRRAHWLQRQLQRRIQRGSVVDAINESVRTAATAFRPDLVWADKQEFLRQETVESIQKLGAKIVHFTPDPYFSLAWKRTALMDATMQSFDVLIYCKSYERAEYEKLGKRVVYMPLGYCDEVHRPLPSTDSKWQCDVGFLGGWEPRRETMLAPLAAEGVNLKIWGGYWDFLRDGRTTLRRRIIMNQLAGGQPYSIRSNDPLANCLQGAEVYGDDYARALTGSRIGLGFLRHVCPDQHTTRTFEIPACGSMLLADRTEEHQEFFDEGKEADFFSSKAELRDKISFYIKHTDARTRVARAGYERSVRGGYAYVNRLAHVIPALAL